MDERRLTFFGYNRGWLLAAPERELYWGLPAAERFHADARALFTGVEPPHRRLYVGARGASRDWLEFWRAADALPWEDLEVDGRRLLDRGCVIVRTTGDVARAPVEPPPPVVVGEDGPRVLVLSANPAGRSFDARPFIDDLKEATAEACCAPPVETRLTAGIERDRAINGPHRWDFVVVLAHGHRTATGGQIILERAADQDKDPRTYHAFATVLANTLTREFSGVIFLGVCSSSPLAIELCHEMPRCRVIAFRNEEELKLLQQFFRRFVRALFGVEPAEHAPKDTSVVELCFASTARALSVPLGNARPLSPVLYSPAYAAAPAFFELSRPAFLRELRGRLDRGLEEALDFARGHRDDSGDPARDLAALCCEELSALVNFDHNLRRLAAQIDQWAGARRWRQVHDEFRGLPFHTAATAGPAAVADDSVPSPRFLRAEWQAADVQRWTALDALGHLVRYEDGELDALVEGCARLARFEPVRLRPAGEELAGRVFERECEAIVSEVESTLRLVAQADPPGDLRALVELVDRSSRVRRLLDDRPSAAVQARLERTVDAIRQVADALVVVRADRAVTASKSRLELVSTLLERRSEPSTCTAAERFGRAPADLPGLREHLQAIALRASDDPAAAIAAAPVPLLINERAPIRLCGELAGGLHPYLLLGPHGGHADACIDTLVQVAEALLNVGDSRRDDALAHLRNTAFRLRLDVGLLPVEDVARASKSVQYAWERLLAGRPLDDGLPDDLSPLDRLTALVVVGRADEAASEAYAQFCRCALDEALRWNVRFDWTLATFLLCTYAAELARDVAGKSLHLERAIAAVGMLLGDKPALNRWIGSRLAVYRQEVPDQPQLAQIQRDVTLELHNHLTRQFSLLAALPDGAAAANHLSRELAAELRGSALSHLLRRPSSRPPAGSTGAEPQLARFTGGYLAARAFGKLDEVGARLRRHYIDLTGSEPVTYLGLAASRGLTQEVFHELVFCFSALRHYFVDELEVEPPPCEDPDGPSFRERYPMHAVLERSLASQVLGAHIALATALVQIRHLRPVLQRRPLPRTDIVRRIDGISEMQRRLGHSRYRLCADTVGVAATLGQLLTGWIDQELARVGSSSVNDTLARLEDVLMLFDNLAGAARTFTEILAPLRAKLAAGVASLCVQRRDWMRAFVYIGQAIEESPREVAFLESYLHIAINVYDHQREENRTSAERILHEAIRRAEGFAGTSPPSTGAREMLDRLKHRRDALSLRTAKPVDRSES